MHQFDENFSELIGPFWSYCWEYTIIERMWNTSDHKNFITFFNLAAISIIIIVRELLAVSEINMKIFTFLNVSKYFNFYKSSRFEDSELLVKFLWIVHAYMLFRFNGKYFHASTSVYNWELQFNFWVDLSFQNKKFHVSLISLKKIETIVNLFISWYFIMQGSHVLHFGLSFRVVSVLYFSKKFLQIYWLRFINIVYFNMNSSDIL